MPSITAIPQPMLMPRYEPFASLLSTVCATTPTPNAIRMKVPKNSAAASRAVPLSIGGFYRPRGLEAKRPRAKSFHAKDNDVLPGQALVDVIEHVAFRLELLLHFGDAHLV